jgi:hypothetical protein
LVIPSSFVIGHSSFLSARVAADAPVTLTVRPGQSPAEVRDRLGPPLRVTRQVLFRHYVEQWVYDKDGLVLIAEGFGRPGTG